MVVCNIIMVGAQRRDFEGRFSQRQGSAPVHVIFELGLGLSEKGWKRDRGSMPAGAPACAKGQSRRAGRELEEKEKWSLVP